jgi:type I restriction enzyme R subunit
VKERFVEFARRYANRPEQTQFLRLLQNHIEKYGSITLEKLYEAPFTSINSDGPDGLFSQDSQVEALIQIIETFQPEELTSP